MWLKLSLYVKKNMGFTSYIYAINPNNTLQNVQQNKIEKSIEGGGGTITLHYKSILKYGQT